MNTSKALQIFEFKIFSDMTVVFLFHKRERENLAIPIFLRRRRGREKIQYIRSLIEFACCG